MGPTSARRGLTLDAGALIALERGGDRALALVRTALAEERAITVPAGALAQAWRGGPRQPRLGAFLGDVDVDPLDAEAARAAGVLCGRRGTADVVDASVVISARSRGDLVVTSDPADLVRLDPSLLVRHV